MSPAAPLTERHCQPREGEAALTAEAARLLLAQLTNWTLDAKTGVIERTWRFKNFHETMAFVNAVAWVAHREDHHPDLDVGYNRCHVKFHTHSVNGLTENDFICAAHIDALGGRSQSEIATGR